MSPQSTHRILEGKNAGLIKQAMGLDDPISDLDHVTVEHKRQTTIVTVTAPEQELQVVLRTTPDNATYTRVDTLEGRTTTWKLMYSGAGMPKDSLVPKEDRLTAEGRPWSYAKGPIGSPQVLPIKNMEEQKTFLHSMVADVNAALSIIASQRNKIQTPQKDVVAIALQEILDATAIDETLQAQEPELKRFKRQLKSGARRAGSAARNNLGE